MDLEAYLAENFEKVYAAPTHIGDFFKKSGFDIAELAEKTQVAAQQPKDVVDFEELMNVSTKKLFIDYKNKFQAVINSDHWDMQPYIALGQAYVDYLLDSTEPQFPGFMWGLLNCLEYVILEF